MSRTPATPKRSWSLVEVMASIAISAVLASLAIMGLSQYTSTSEVYQSSNDVRSDLEVCRRWAIDHDRPCAFGVALADFNLSYPGFGGAYTLSTFYGRSVSSLQDLYAQGRCWDILPAEPFDSGSPCDMAWTNADLSPGLRVYNENTATSTLLDRGHGLTSEPRVSLIGVGGEANTSKLSIAAGTGNTFNTANNFDIGYLSPWPGAIVFMPDGRLLNDESDFDCQGHINLWVGSRTAWQADHTKTYVEVSVTRQGHVSWRNGESAHVDPYPDVQHVLYQQGKNACP